MTGSKPIVAVMVLYKTEFEESLTYQTLHAAMREEPTFAREMEFVVADNSREAQATPAGFEGRYVHDGRNAGLAERYNTALDIAVRSGAGWLLLLDQDTKLTVEYLREVRVRVEELWERTEIVAIAPKLVMHGRIYSPHTPQFQRVGYSVGLESEGVVGEMLHVFNSAAVVRVSALEAIGGFPAEYPLDYLDHATFTRLQRAGGRIFVMRSVMQHDLSEANPQASFVSKRAHDKLMAEERYFQTYATGRQRFWRRVDLLRQVIGHGRRGRFKAAALRFRFMLRGA